LLLPTTFEKTWRRFSKTFTNTIDEKKHIDRSF
jgi:hypothetical protein